MQFVTARHSKRPTDDPIFALNREATERRARGDKVINATVGALLEDDGSLAVIPTVVEAIREVNPARGAAYAPIAGNPDFLAATIDDMVGGTSLAQGATAVATPGGTGALRHAVATFLDQGQSLLTTSFHWGPYATVCDEHERKVRTFNMFADHGGLDVDALARSLGEIAREQGRVLLFLNDPCHNPTGYSMTDGEWSRVAQVLGDTASRVPLTLLVDTAYRAYAKNPRGLLPHLEAIADRAMVLFAWSASKSYTQYGLRVGALIACTKDPEQRGLAQRALSYASRGTWSNCSAAGQIAIARCLTDATLRSRVETERARLTALLDARVRAFNDAARGTALSYPRYDGGFFVTVFAKDAVRVGTALKNHGVFAVPQVGAVRVALCGVAESDIPALVRALDAELRAAG